MTVASNSSRRSYRLAQISAKTFPASRSNAGSSTRLVISTAIVESARYEYRLHATIPAPPAESPCLAPPCCTPDSTDAQSVVSWSWIGTRVRVSTLVRAAHRSIVPCPYWLIPVMTRVSGSATAGLDGEISAANSARLCQKRAPASSTLSKKSSRANACPPQPTSTEWYCALPGRGHSWPTRHIFTRPGVYTIELTVNLSRNTPELISSARKLPTRGRRCVAGQSTAPSAEAGTAVCQIVSLTRIVAGLSQNVLLVVLLPPWNVPRPSS